MANEYYWKVWLRPNLLTKDDDNDYIAEVLTQKDTLPDGREPARTEGKEKL